LQAEPLTSISRRQPASFGRRFSTLQLPLILLGLVAITLSMPQKAMTAVTLAELKADANLTPERLMRHFADFKFELGRDVQKPEEFLKNQAGDCDDFATLAADVLRAKGYTTRLVVVYMAHDVHVVCYVAEANSYLDYNCRKKASPLMKCDGGLTSIASSVAESFRAPWRSASEFKFQNGTRQFVSTVFH
jgi:hypothetical protein